MENLNLPGVANSKPSTYSTDSYDRTNHTHEVRKEGSPVEHSLGMSPGELKLKKRHTRILATLNKRASKEFVNQ